jgi:hypothetical protein
VSLSALRLIGIVPESGDAETTTKNCYEELAFGNLERIEDIR